MKLEEEAIKEAAKNFPSEGDMEEKLSGKTTSEDDAVLPKSSESTPVVVVTLDDHLKPNCKYYLRQACRHGKKGTNCRFNHTKLCFKIIKHGDKRNGCKKGANCEYFHPKLCSAFKSGLCTRKKCSSYHIAGNKFPKQDDVNPTNDVAVISPPRTNRNKTARPQPHRDNSPRSVLNPSPSSTGNIYWEQPASDQYANVRYFLEMKVQVKQIQDQIQMLIATRQLQGGCRLYKIKCKDISRTLKKKSKTRKNNLFILENHYQKPLGS